MPVCVLYGAVWKGGKYSKEGRDKWPGRWKTRSEVSCGQMVKVLKGGEGITVQTVKAVG